MILPSHAGTGTPDRSKQVHQKFAIHASQSQPAMMPLMTAGSGMLNSAEPADPQHFSLLLICSKADSAHPNPGDGAYQGV